MKTIEKNRNYGIDIIRILAVILVLTVHFFLNTDLVKYPKYGMGMKIQVIIKNFCMICVPLFMTITGFLNKRTEYNKSFFKGLINILIVWFFYSLFEYYTLNIIHSNTDVLNLRDFINSLTSFTANGYSWYIEMYIGLYLISPVINTAYNVFDKGNRKKLVVISFCGLILPVFINDLFKDIIHLPWWWAQMYPVAYYIAGKYIADIKPNIRKKTLIFIIVITQILSLSFDLLPNVNIEYITLTTFVSTISVFLLLYNIELKNNVVKKILVYISNITLDIYLGSSLIDRIIYPLFNEKMTSMGISQSHIILYAPIVLIIIFVLSTIYGSIRKLIINVR